MKKPKSIFVCSTCGFQSLKWLGQCPDCQSWDSFVEEIKSTYKIADKIFMEKQELLSIKDIKLDKKNRYKSNIEEFDRVLGGGIIKGSVILIGGEPGIGKSTLMLQIISKIAEADKTCLYVSGEESEEQIKLRSLRVGASSENVFLLSERNIEAIVQITKKFRPFALLVDSIQTMFHPEISSSPGSVSQVREATMRLMIMAKKENIPVFLISHVTKEGYIAGPKTMEHMVDTVLYFEGDSNYLFRILKAAKNRFGSINEIGVFEMGEKGLVEVKNPSLIFLSERQEKVSGSVITSTVEGSRPILIEIQGLTSVSAFASSKRTVIGLDYNRVGLLLAIIEKKLKINIVNHDVFMNVVGGVKIFEPASDLAIIAAVVSSFLDNPILQNSVLIGEVGLTGEIRSVSYIDLRIQEAIKMGFSNCIVPDQKLSKKYDINIIKVANLEEAMQAFF